MRYFSIVIISLAGIFSGSLLLACQPELSLDSPPTDCTDFGMPKVSLQDLKKYYLGQTRVFPDSVQWEGYVVSSDASSNLFGEVYLQDDPENPSGGLVLRVDLSGSHVILPYGARVALNLKGLYLGKSGDSFELGGAFPSFGNIGIGRLPASKLSDHVRVLCAPLVEPGAVSLNLEELRGILLNTLVELKGVEFIEEDIGFTFAEQGEQTRRNLQDCAGNAISVRNSGYSDFYSLPLPAGNGRAMGILSSYRNSFELLIMNPSDLTFDQLRCEDRIVKKTSNQILISEIADPDNLPEARFIELFNASDSIFELHGWELQRFTNANTEPGLKVFLDGLTINPGQAMVLSAFPDVFQDTYGFAPDLEAPSNGPADSNGDDSVELIDPFGNVVDVFGRPGTDGSGTSHEFEDGRAIRKKEVVRASSVFDSAQWIIFNDSGGNGTVEQPQKAPQDFSPGRH